MIKIEDLKNRICHYSDAGLKIRQIETGMLYDNTVDVLPCRYTYEETNETDKVVNILLGGKIK